MANWIDPRCAIPTFLLDNEDVAGHCGKLSGYVTAAVLTLIILAVSIGLYFYTSSKNMNPNLLTFIGVTLIAIFFLWIILPYFNSWSRRVTFRSFDAQLKAYQGNGMDRKAAIEKLQDLYQTEIQASAIGRAGDNIATGVFANAAKGLKMFNKKN